MVLSEAGDPAGEDPRECHCGELSVPFARLDIGHPLLLLLGPNADLDMVALYSVPLLCSCREGAYSGPWHYSCPDDEVVVARKNL